VTDPTRTALEEAKERLERLCPDVMFEHSGDYLRWESRLEAYGIAFRDAHSAAAMPEGLGSAGWKSLASSFAAAFRGATAARAEAATQVLPPATDSTALVEALREAWQAFNDAPRGSNEQGDAIDRIDALFAAYREAER
jgi:hypothetical protein